MKQRARTVPASIPSEPTESMRAAPTSRLRPLTTKRSRCGSCSVRARGTAGRRETSIAYHVSSPHCRIHRLWDTAQASPPGRR